MFLYSVLPNLIHGSLLVGGWLVRKARLITLEQAFVLIAISLIFIVTFHQMSTDGVLPGNDPAVHLLEVKDDSDEWKGNI